MPEATLEVIIKKVLRSAVVGKELMINWHLGEPMAVPIEFYEHAIQCVDKYNHCGIHVTHTIQTNGTLINDKWCQFFRNNGFGIGISIDGPAFIHDRVRVTREGNGTHARICNGLRLLREHGLGYAGLCVLTDFSLDYPDAIYEFFSDNGFSALAFNVEEIESANVHTTLSSSSQSTDSVIRDRYSKFMSRVFDRWHSDEFRLRIREFDDTLESIRRKVNDPHFYRNRDMGVLSILSFKHNGDITAFSPELAGGTLDDPKAFVVGNVFDIDEIESLLNSPRLRQFSTEIYAGIQQCAETCEYFDLCGGGFSSNKVFENGSFNSTETSYCVLHRKALADVIIKKLESDTEPAT